MDVTSLLRRSVQFNGDRIAVVFGEKRQTYNQTWKRAVGLANALAAIGLKPGDMVATLEDNNLAAVDAFVGLAIGGFVRVPLYTQNSKAAHKSMLEQTRCKAVLCSPEHFHEIDGLTEQLSDLEHVLVRDENYLDWLDAHGGPDPEIKCDEDSLFQIRFTGGTTGIPKGVPATHRQFLNQVRDWFYTFPPATSQDAVLHAAPITHASGTLFIPLWATGGRNVLLSQFDPTVVLTTIQNEKINYMFLPPTAINAVCRHPNIQDFNTSSIRVMMSAAAPITEETSKLAHDIFGDAMYQGYGLSECFPITMMSARDWFLEREGSNPSLSCGLPLPWTRVELWNDEEEPVPIGSEGEIVAKSDGQMTEYWRAPDSTAEGMKDGWVKTGDVGKLDQNGYLYVLDRKKDLIISGGFNLYPTEIENVISQMEGVIEVAVVGIPHEKWGETPAAFIYAKPDARLTEEQVIEFASDTLGSYKKPRLVEFSDGQLPRTPVGKIDKKKIRAPFWTSSNRNVAGA